MNGFSVQNSANVLNRYKIVSDDDLREAIDRVEYLDQQPHALRLILIQSAS